MKKSIVWLLGLGFILFMVWLIWLGLFEDPYYRTEIEDVFTPAPQEIKPTPDILWDGK